MKYILNITIILVLGSCTITAKVGYSTQKLLKLLNAEQEFAEKLNIYADLLSEKIAALNLYINSIEHNPTENQREREEYVCNPLNAFSLMRRTHRDMPNWHNYAITDVGYRQLSELEDLFFELFMKNALEEMQNIPYYCGYTLDPFQTVELNVCNNFLWTCGATYASNL